MGCLECGEETNGKWICEECDVKAIKVYKDWKQK